MERKAEEMEKALKYCMEKQQEIEGALARADRKIEQSKSYQSKIEAIEEFRKKVGEIVEELKNENPMHV